MKKRYYSKGMCGDVEKHWHSCLEEEDLGNQ